jgi:DNA-binding NarL/FixJ family response regulator
MRILIVDDHLSVAELYSSALAGEHEKVGVAITGADVLPRLRTGGYDCVLLDLVLPDVDGIELLAQIKRTYTHVKVIAATGWDVPELYVRARENGADGFVPKAQGLRPLRAALAAVAAGGTWFPDQAPPVPAQSGVHPITERQVDILRALAAGYHENEIADWLGITTGTVEEHIAHLKVRFHARTVAELVHAAIRAGDLSPLRPAIPPPPRPPNTGSASEPP